MNLYIKSPKIHNWNLFLQPGKHWHFEYGWSLLLTKKVGRASWQRSLDHASCLNTAVFNNETLGTLNMAWFEVFTYGRWKWREVSYSGQLRLSGSESTTRGKLCSDLSQWLIVQCLQLDSADLVGRRTNLNKLYFCYCCWWCCWNYW